MDTMQLRIQGSPRHPLRMRLAMFVTRICLAAYLTDKNASAMLGPAGHFLKYVITRTHTRALVLRLCVKDAGRLLGIGGQYLVFASAQQPGTVEKYSYTLAGCDGRILAQAVADYALEHQQMVAHYGDLVQPTSYDTAALPLRGPLGVLQTVRARQPQLRAMLDVFAPEAERWLRGPYPNLRRDVATITRQTRAWMAQDKWLDLIGPDNVVITQDHGEPRLRIIDTETYVAGYLADVNPVLGKPYREVLLDRLRAIETYTKLLAVSVLLLGCAGFLHTPAGGAVWRRSFAFADRIEDSAEAAIGRFGPSPRAGSVAVLLPAASTAPRTATARAGW